MPPFPHVKICAPDCACNQGVSIDFLASSIGHSLQQFPRSQPNLTALCHCQFRASLSHSVSSTDPPSEILTLCRYIEGRCVKQVARAGPTRSATRQRLNQREKSNNPEIQLSCCRRSDSFHRSNAPTLQRFNAPTASGPSSPVKAVRTQSINSSFRG